ncbi:MAG: hypothetical protein KatS3mg008_1730 [Acidimicrobiales bacterium]|nr:MAG: hypothetical protein KatS3mg008_1730 [Acidimicrobiales bacterium]
MAASHVHRCSPHRVRHRKCTPLLVVLACALPAAAACSKSDTANVSLSDLEGEAQVLQWPDDRPPSARVLSAWAAATGATINSARNQVAFANICAWYSTWHRQHKQGSVSPEVVSYLRNELPHIEFEQTIAGSREWLESLAADAAKSRPSAIESFLQLNKCDLLERGNSQP